MFNVQRKKAIVWVVAILMVIMSVGVVVVAEDAEGGQAGNVIEEVVEQFDDSGSLSVEETPPVVEEAPVAVSPPVENIPPVAENTPPPQTEPQEMAPVEYTVRYVYFEGSEKKTITVKVLDNEMIEKPSFVPAMEGYTFIHWYDAELSDAAGFAFGHAPVKNMTLKAFFVEIPKDLEGNDQIVPNEQANIELTMEETTEMVDESAEALEDMIEGEFEAEAEPETVLEEEIAQANIDVAVTVTCDTGEFVQYGDTITLTAQASGLEGLAYTAIWRYASGGEWVIVQSGPELVCRYMLTEDNFDATWEVEIVINQPAEESEPAIEMDGI